MTMEKEKKMQEWNHVQMNQEMFHHHHDHVKCDRMRPGAEIVPFWLKPFLFKPVSACARQEVADLVV